MAKVNYNFEKRQREIAKKKKKEEKLQKKLNQNKDEPQTNESSADESPEKSDT